MEPRRIVAIVPVRSLEGGKSRLAEHLDPEERADLVTRLLRRTIDAAAAAVERVIVVSPDIDVLAVAAAAGADTLEEPASGLNVALDAGRRRAVAAGAEAVLVLPPDLARIDAAEVAGFVASAGPSPVVALVPDRHGNGTNALFLAPPGVVDFGFGSASRERHASAARAAGARFVEVDGPLTLDIDTPDDLLLAQAESARAHP